MGCDREIAIQTLCDEVARAVSAGGPFGVTVHLVDEGLDTGTVLGQRRVDLRGARTLEDVETRGLAVEHELYSEVLANFIKADFRVESMPLPITRPIKTTVQRY